MSNDFDLVLPGEAKPVVTQEAAAVEVNYLTLESITDADTRAKVAEFAEKIAISNAIDVQEYGVKSQTEVSELATDVLKRYKTRDSEVIGQDLVSLVMLIKGYDAKVTEIQKQEPGFFQKLMKGAKTKATLIQTEYSSVSANVDKIVNLLESHNMALRQSIVMLDELFKRNLKAIDSLKFYIIAGKEYLKRYNSEEIPRLENEAITSGDPVVAQRLNDAKALANKFEKKLYTLMQSRMVSIQTSAEIRMVSGIDEQIMETISDQILLGIPAWMNQMVVALAIEEAGKANDASVMVRDHINTSMVKTSEMLKDTSLKVAEASQQPMIDDATIAAINKNIVDTINGVAEITRKGMEQIRQGVPRIAQYESELKNALIL